MAPGSPWVAGMWRSLVAHLTGGQGVAGSNPVIPTNSQRADPAQWGRPVSLRSHRSPGVSLGAQQVVETNVEIRTPDGTCDAAFIHPASGSHPAVVIWPDAFGLRPSMRDIARRLAAEGGYSVLVPSPFYRVAKAPVFEDAANFNF